MGFFKKIGAGVKKFAKKNVNFKTLVKYGSMVDPSGLAGGIQAQHQAKKEAKEMERQEALSNQSAVENFANNETSRKNPNFMDILTAGGAGALTSIGQTLGGSTTAGQAGASLVDSTLTAWLKANWWKVLLGLSVVGGIIYFAVRRGNKGYSRRRR